MAGGDLKNKALRLSSTVQNYEWGKHGRAGEVGRLYSLISKSPPEEDKPYAELWMGTHDSGHSLVVSEEEHTGKLPLRNWLQEHPEALGDKVLERWGIDLPFLFKVLSVGKALSIQAHPDKDLAQALHQAQPKVYKDSNHKPEMVLALTEFEALCGFVDQQVRNLTLKEQLVLRLEKQYPNDIGVISAFFFNYVKLVPGEALYLDANEPHAYLYGECVECMATSDNVVRAGLTPKYRDVETLCSMLTYKQGMPEILQGVPLNPFTTRYSPPFYEFEVDRCILPFSTTVTFPAVSGPSIFLVLYGEGVMTQKLVNDESIINVQEGDVFFVPAGIQLDISSIIEENIEANKEHRPLHLYRAGVNSRVFE
ncbi:mannose-6-phosphate isomerase 1 isoform X2 [Cryptomeria japonica]|uniref:mannose-6-phosphate isomerase 1 isoform X2 n=1 Tax=Cryptomeria japonica TaxID=3369 RepID=UPI0027D9E1E1|nr:mannose-6-phosphate isomerase 1 isoform X2 [Cryptomeria japonica]